MSNVRWDVSGGYAHDDAVNPIPKLIAFLLECCEVFFNLSETLYMLEWRNGKTKRTKSL